MSNKKTKVCLLMLVMLLGASVVTSNSVFAKDETMSTSGTELAQEELKATKETLERAQDSINKKDFQSAIVYLTAYISAKPKKYEAYKMRGDAFYALHQFKLAEIDYQKAIALKTDDDKFVTGTKVLGAVVLGADKQSQYQNPEIGNLYGRLMYAQKAQNNPSYEATYQKAFQFNSHIYLPRPKKEDIAKINCPQKYGKLLNPQGVDVYITDAISEIEDGQFHEAVYKIQYVTTNYPKYYFGHYLMGVAMTGLEHYEDAIHSFETSLKYNPYDFESFASLGQIYYRKAEKSFSADDAKKSIEYFNKAIVYNPNCHIYHYYIGLDNMVIGDYDSAITEFDNAIKLKANDYNSLYYKLIAQHIKGEYNSVVDGTTNLLYRHVSNYNSVLYLRALAYYKLGNNTAALSDLEKVHNNMNDIYNEDIKPLSAKEQTLSNYLYYLKAMILQAEGQGIKADLAKAYENPVIASLARYKEGAIGNVRLSAKQVDTEYDYIRTTFDNLNVSFVYLKPDYKLISLSPETKSTVVAEQAASALKQSTDPFDTLSSGQTSIAQMLATQSFGTIQSKPTSIGYDVYSSTSEVEEYKTKTEESIEETVAEVEGILEELSHLDEEVVAQEKEDKSISEKIVKNEEAENIEKTTVKYVVVEPEPVAESLTEPEKIACVAEAVEEKLVKVEAEVENVAKTVEEKVEEVSEQTELQSKEVVEEVKQDVEQTANDAEASVEKFADNVESEATQVVSDAAQVVKSIPTVVEKHANVNLSEFNTVQTRKVLVLKEDDEVIEFEPATLSEKVDKAMSHVITPINSVDSNKISEEIVKNQQLTEDAVQQEVANTNAISEEVKSSPVDVNITQSEVTAKVAEVPAVVIPPVEVKLPEKEIEVKKEEVVPELPDDFEELMPEVKNVNSTKTIEEIIAPEIEAVTKASKPKKEKKSWLSRFKRNKNESSSKEIEATEIIPEQESLDEVSSELEETMDKIPTEDPVEELKIVEELKEDIKENVVQTENVISEDDSDIPVIRTKKAEVEEIVEVADIQPEKKKFTWWRNRNKQEKTEKTCIPKEKTISKKINWKKFFTPEPKSEIKVVEQNSESLETSENAEEAKFIPTSDEEEVFGQ